MGLPCSTAACYRRMATTDEYDEDALWYSTRNGRVDTETFLMNQLGKFHYEVHMFAMMVSPYEKCRTKAVYLYIDGVRVLAARATFDAGSIRYVSVQYRSLHWRDLFHDAQEVVPNGRIGSIQKYFHEYYKWYQSVSGGSVYGAQWPTTLYKASKEVCDFDRDNFSGTYEISL